MAYRPMAAQPKLPWYRQPKSQAMLGSLGSSLLAMSAPHMPTAAAPTRASFMGPAIRQAMTAGTEAEDHGRLLEKYGLERKRKELEIESLEQALTSNKDRRAFLQSFLTPQPETGSGIPTKGQLNLGGVDPRLIALSKNPIEQLIDLQKQEHSTQKDATGVLRYTSGPNIGEAVPGFNQGEMQSTQGREFLDLQRIEKLFGSNSPEALAFRGSIAKNAVTLGDESTMRAQFVGLSKKYTDVKSAYFRIASLADDPENLSPAGDLGLVFNIMKMFDPGSVVRESEFATAENAAGVPERVRNVFNKVLEGVKLSPNQRKDFVSVAGKLIRAATTSQVEIENQYKTIAEKKGIDPEVIVLDFVGRLRDSDVLKQKSDQKTTTRPRWVPENAVEKDGKWYMPDPKSKSGWSEVIETGGD